MRIDRRDLKRRARDAMRTACPNVLLMTFVYLLLTTGLSLVVGLWATDPVGKVLELYQQGLPLGRALPLAVAGVGSVGLFTTILMAIFGVVVDFGYSRWCLYTARGTRGELGDLIDGFSMVGRILWLRVLISAYGLLWGLVIFMPAAYIALFIMLVLSAGMWVFRVAFVVALVAWCFRVARYSMATYCLLDEPDMGASWAMRRSRQMMQGRVKDYVVLQMSFLGWSVAIILIVAAMDWVLTQVTVVWYALAGVQVGQPTWIGPLLSILTLLPGWVLGLWLKPYVAITECNFYNQIKDGAQRTSN